MTYWPHLLQRVWCCSTSTDIKTNPHLGVTRGDCRVLLSFTPPGRHISGYKNVFRCPVQGRRCWSGCGAWFRTIDMHGVEMLEIKQIYCMDCVEEAWNCLTLNQLTWRVLPHLTMTCVITRSIHGISRALLINLFRVTKNGGIVVWIVGDTTKNFCEIIVVRLTSYWLPWK